MGCGESKHAVATENATVPKNKRSLSSKSNGETQISQESVKKNTENGESGVAETAKTSDEKVEVKAKVDEATAPKVVAVEKEKAKEKSEKKEMVGTTEEVFAEKKEEKVVESQPGEKKNSNDETTPAVAAVDKTESVEEINVQDKAGLSILFIIVFC